MDRKWAADQLRVFVNCIDGLEAMEAAEGERYDEATEIWSSPGELADRIISMDPVMRTLMNAAQPKLGDYQGFASWNQYGSEYWLKLVRHHALQAIGIHTLGAEALERMRPDSPELVADRFHDWVWKAAAPMWEAGATQEAVNAAARSVNARLQQKLGRHNSSEADLCRQSFSLNDSVPGQPRLRFPGDRSSATWRSRQQGGIDFGAGCFEGIRNPASHEHRLQLPDQVALEQLAALSVLARWIEQCEVERAEVPAQPGPDTAAVSGRAVSETENVTEQP